MESSEGLKRRALPCREHDRQRIPVERCAYPQSTCQDRVAVFTFARKVHRSAVEGRRRSSCPHCGFGRRGRPAPAVRLVPMYCSECVAGSFGGVDDAGEFEQRGERVRHDRRRYPLAARSRLAGLPQPIAIRRAEPNRREWRPAVAVCTPAAGCRTPRRSWPPRRSLPIA